MRQGTSQISFRQLLCAFALLALVHGSTPVRAEPGEPQALPDRQRAAALIRSTLLSLNEANLTDNYSVLRAASAPDFQRLFSEERLAAIFTVLRTKQVDLSVAALNEPVIKRATYIAGQKALMLQGTVPASAEAPLRFETNFKFAYQYIDGRWRLLRLELSLDPASQPRLQTVGAAL